MIENCILDPINGKTTLPLVYKSIKFGHSVLFVTQFSGVVVDVTDESTNPLGLFSTNWISCFDASIWTPVNAIIKFTH